MVPVPCRLLIFCAFVATAFAAPRQHTVVLGKWHTVQITQESGTAEQGRMRRLIIDERTREYTTGNPHQISERLFVIRRLQRVNDSLPEEDSHKPRWIWRVDGWISVDRQTGHVAVLNLPAFDPETSQVNWYRDYAAYCGSSDDGSKTYMLVVQLAKRKPVLKKEITGPLCPAPDWERNPSRVTFIVAGQKSTFAVNARGADLKPESNTEEGPQ